jgi:hypothetical protein
MKACGDRVLEGRDYILFSQRGTHYAEPSLECPGHVEFGWELAAQHLGQAEREAREYDPVTPPDWGRLAAETLDNSFFYELPGIGHGAMCSNKCGLELSLQFLADPTAAPDASCVSDLPGPDFRHQ